MNLRRPNYYDVACISQKRKKNETNTPVIDAITKRQAKGKKLVIFYGYVSFSRVVFINNCQNFANGLLDRNSTLTEERY